MAALLRASNLISKMLDSASRKVEKIDMEALEKFNKSLICYYCKKPPRPSEKLYSHKYGCHPEIITCKDCASKTCSNGIGQSYDLSLTKFLSIFKLWHCIFHKNGCTEELEAKDLNAHEEICLFRDVTCPKLGCNMKIPFNGIVDHYQEKHTDLKIIDNVLDFKGSLEDLTKSTFILNSYGMPFFPQFKVTDKMVLNFWVFGHGAQAEINSFDLFIKFFLNGQPRFGSFDSVKGINVDHDMLTLGQSCMMVPVKRLTQYYDVESNEFKDQECIEFQMEIMSEKLDEVAKDKNNESGIEDSEIEEK